MQVNFTFGSKASKIRASNSRLKISTGMVKRRRGLGMGNACLPVFLPLIKKT